MTLITFALCVLSQVQVQVQLPQIVFPAPPPLVVVEPGIQVVEDNDDEVFFVDNLYWVRRDGRWFRSKDHKGNWVVVDAPVVPPVLVKQTPGKYKRWKKNKGVGGPPDDNGNNGNNGNDGNNGKGKGKGKKK